MPAPRGAGHYRQGILGSGSGELIGITTFFSNFVTIVVLLLAWLIVLLAFFVLSAQLLIAIHPPKTVEAVRRNPLGIYVHAFSTSCVNPKSPHTVKYADR